MLSYEQKSCLVFQVVFNEEQCSLVTHTVDCIQLDSCKSLTIFVFFTIHLYFWCFSVTKFYDQKKMPISLSLSFARKLFLAHRQDLGGHRPWGASCKVENGLWTWASRHHPKTGLQNSRELQGMEVYPWVPDLAKILFLFSLDLFLPMIAAPGIIPPVLCSHPASFCPANVPYVRLYEPFDGGLQHSCQWYKHCP